MIDKKKKLSDEKLENVVGGTRMSQTEVGITPTPLELNREKAHLIGEETSATQTDFAVKFDKKIDSLR